MNFTNLTNLFFSSLEPHDADNLTDMMIFSFFHSGLPRIKYYYCGKCNPNVPTVTYSIIIGIYHIGMSVRLRLEKSLIRGLIREIKRKRKRERDHEIIHTHIT